MASTGSKETIARRAAKARCSHSGRAPFSTDCLNNLKRFSTGAMGAIHERGFGAFPKTSPSWGFDDIELSAYTEPAHCPVPVSRAELAALAFRCLYQPAKKPRGAWPHGRSRAAAPGRPRIDRTAKNQAYSCLYPIGVPCRLCSVVRRLVLLHNCKVPWIQVNHLGWRYGIAGQ
jgi:hypothetical protein